MLDSLFRMQAKIPAPVDQYLTRLQGLEAVKAGLASAQSSREASSQQAQTSASAPSQTPVLPIKGRQLSICHINFNTTQQCIFDMKAASKVRTCMPSVPWACVHTAAD